LPSSQQVQLSVVLPPSNNGQLQTLLHNLYNPSSPGYHQWLRPGQFAGQFGPSTVEVDAVESWLHGAGLTQTTVSGSAVKVSAPVAQVSAALGTSFKQYQTRSGRRGYLAQTAPLVPQSLAGGQIVAILGLNTLSSFEPENTSIKAEASSANGGLQPNADGLTSCSAAKAEAAQGYYTLDTLGAAYGVDSLLADGQDGNGETIGVYELASHSGSDVATYEDCFGLTNSVSTVSIDGGGGAVGGDGTAEADLDIEQAATQAPGASVISYEGPNTAQGAYDTWSSMVTSDAAQVISTSWGECELAAESDGTIGSYTELFERAASQGQTIFAASGDSGSEDCYPYYSSTTEQVDYPASDAWVTAVGGTSLYGVGDEAAWNRCQSDESTACANVLNGEGAGGGGMSRYEPRPTDQPNILYWSTPKSCGHYCREVPDISANAGIGMVIEANGGWTAEGGTSFAAPFMAGLVADRDDGCTTLTGVWTPVLYALAAEGSYGTALTDITSGNTDLTGSNGGAYPATSGYDAASGLGSPLAAGLSCPEVTSVSAGYSGSQVTISGLGLEHNTISFGGIAAQVLSATATSATVVVPAGGGTVMVHATSVLGTGTQTTSFTYGSPPPPPPPPPPPSPPPPVLHGYDLVGSDGGVFVFGGGFFGSLPGVGVHVNNVTGIVPTASDTGYFLVGSDGGVFAFNAPFANSLPGIGVHVNDIVGIVPTLNDQGYFLVGRDGGVFSFNAPFENSLPGIGIYVNDITGIAATADDNGYWLVGSDGSVYAFGDAHSYGNGPAGAVGITVTHDGGGYWIVGANGAVTAFGDAGKFGDLPSIGVTVHNIMGIVVSPDSQGYNLIGSDGGTFSFGDATYDGSLPGLGVRVNDVVGAVPT